MSSRSGFTLIEISIVLVIIALIIGGVLVGQDLIAAAAVRSQISQFEKLNSAVNTFRGKYGNLPGDIPDPSASQFGFNARGTSPGEGDGNGLIQSYVNGSVSSSEISFGEPGLFWSDLAKAGLIPGTYAGYVAWPGFFIDGVAPQNLNPLIIPPAAIGNGNWLGVWNNGVNTGWQDGYNYYMITAIQAVTDPALGRPDVAMGLTVAQAYGIDKKIDDGLPQSGKVFAYFPGAAPLGQDFLWAAGGGNFGDNSVGWLSDGSPAPPGHTTAYASTNCYDTADTPGIETYSMAKNAQTVNCGLSIRFQ